MLQDNTDIFMYYGCGRWFVGLEVIFFQLSHAIRVLINGFYKVLYTLYERNSILLCTGRQ
jgi:hypothetical protein